MNIGTLTTGADVQTIINLNYCPQYLYYIAATQLTGLLADVSGDGVVCNLDADGLNELGVMKRLGGVANSYVITLADGLVPNKVTTLTFTNSAAQTPIIYGFNGAPGSHYFVSQKNLVLANSSLDFANFMRMGIVSPTVNDIITITYRNGIVQKLTAAELLAIISFQENQNSYYTLDNFSGDIVNVNYIPDTNRTIYTSLPMPIGKIS